MHLRRAGRLEPPIAPGELQGTGTAVMSRLWRAALEGFVWAPAGERYDELTPEVNPTGKHRAEPLNPSSSTSETEKSASGELLVENIESGINAVSEHYTDITGATTRVITRMLASALGDGISDTDLRCVAAYDAYLFPATKEMTSHLELSDSGQQQVKLYEPHKTTFAGVLDIVRSLSEHELESLPEY